MEMQIQELSCQYSSAKKDDDIDSFSKSDKSKTVVIKEKIEAVKNNIDKKIIRITKLQKLISSEEQELKKYFDEEKQLIANLKKI